MKIEEVKKLDNVELFQALKSAGIETGSHESDLHVRVCDESRALIERYEFKCNVTDFQADDGSGHWFDVPFAFVKESNIITRKEYMNDSSVLHNDYYSQFVTKSTKSFVLSSLKVEQIQKAIDSGDKHLNSIKIPFNNMSRGGGWWWDGSPVNIQLMREAGEIGPNSLPSQSTHTCVGKAAARMLVENSQWTSTKLTA